MSDLSTSPTETPAEAAPPAKPRPTPRPTTPRPLPSEADIAQWIAGEDVPVVAALFDKHSVKTFDGMVMQIRKEELFPQHWQVISRLEPPLGAEFDRLPVIGRLRVEYRNQELARRRIDALRVAWQELRGRRPSMWTVPDLFAALRRIYDKGLDVDFYDLITGTRDIWRGLTVPAGQEQLDMLWNCLDLMRKKTKK